MAKQMAKQIAGQAAAPEAAGLAHVEEHAGLRAARAKLAELVAVRDRKVDELCKLRAANSSMREKIDTAAEAILAGEAFDQELLLLVRDEDSAELGAALAQQAVNFATRDVSDQYPLAVAGVCRPFAAELAAAEREYTLAVLALIHASAKKLSVFARLSALGADFNAAQNHGGLRLGPMLLGDPRSPESKAHVLLEAAVRQGLLTPSEIPDECRAIWPPAPTGMVLVRFLRAGYSVYNKGDLAGFRPQVADWLVAEGVAHHAGQPAPVVPKFQPPQHSGPIRAVEVC